MALQLQDPGIQTQHVPISKSVTVTFGDAYQLGRWPLPRHPLPLAEWALPFVTCRWIFTNVGRGSDTCGKMDFPAVHPEGHDDYFNL